MKILENFILYIEANCKVDEISGDLECNKCGNKVVIDWFEQKLECQGCDDL
jgi:hypothetical protein